MSDTDEIILVRRFNDLDANPKVFRCRKSALGTKAAEGYVPIIPAVIQHVAGTPYVVGQPVGCGGRSPARTAPRVLGEE